MLEQQSSLPVPITITRSGSFWFEDGSVVPVAPNKDGTQTSFRVHRSVLARRSDVLRDMLTVPQPAASDPTSCVEGCPAVHVADAAEDWEIILHVLYDGGYRHFGHSRSGWSMVPATLRHGSKCALRSVYTEATARMIGFSPVYASNFALLEELSGESSDLTLEKDDLMKLAQLSHDTELPLLKSIQCAILYVCAYLPANDLVHGVKKNRWSAQFLKLCLSTKGMLDRAVGRVWQTLWAGKRSPQCEQSVNCDGVHKDIAVIYTQRHGLDGSHFAQILRYLDGILSEGGGDSDQRHLCARCARHLEKEFDKIQTDVEETMAALVVSVL